MGSNYRNVDFISIATIEESLVQQFWHVGVLANISYIELNTAELNVQWSPQWQIEVYSKSLV